MPFTQSKRAVYGVALVALLVALAGGFLVYRTYFSATTTLDITIIKALNSASKVTSYYQTVDTETKFPDRSMKITGTFLVDNPNKRFASFSTTSLFINTDSKAHVFTHQNIAIGDDVYTKVETSDPLLKASIANGPNWTYFKNGSIPKDKVDIAIGGPVQDNLQIVSANGAYLNLVKKIGASAWGTEQLVRYTFKLSKKAFSISDGPLKAIAGRVSQNGTVDVWVDPNTFTIVHMVFANAPYYSTTTLSKENIPLNIIAPIQKPS